MVSGITYFVKNNEEEIQLSPAGCPIMTDAHKTCTGTYYSNEDTLKEAKNVARNRCALSKCVQGEVSEHTNNQNLCLFGTTKPTESLPFTDCKYDYKSKGQPCEVLEENCKKMDVPFLGLVWNCKATVKGWELTAYLCKEPTTVGAAYPSASASTSPSVALT